MDPERLRRQLEEVRDRVASAATRAGRPTAAVTLVAVTKKTPIEVVRAVVELGVLNLGENYPQELWSKADALEGLPVRWHLIGHLQGNKAKRTYPLLSFVHAVDSLRLLRTLDELAMGLPNPPPVCLQVNTSEEVSKHGWSPEGILQDAEAIAGRQRLPVVGLMTMAGFGTTNDSARPAFVRLRETRAALQARTGLLLPELSMGMSNDFEAAIEEGATLVRVGSALFEGVAS